MPIKIGDRFGKLIVISFIGKTPDCKTSFWQCNCDCGNSKKVRAGNLINHHVSSCGCLQRQNRKDANITHGEASCRSHALTPEYRSWASMIGRCCNSRNKSFKFYGGRGIVVCDRWRSSYPNFLADLGRRPSLKFQIDRIDNDGNYEPNNCRWATPKEQSRNRSSNHHLMIGGIRRTIAEWSEISGISYKVIHARITQLKWDAYKAISHPVR